MKKMEPLVKRLDIRLTKVEADELESLKKYYNTNSDTAVIRELLCDKVMDIAMK
jgi:hypothetical protein